MKYLIIFHLVLLTFTNVLGQNKKYVEFKTFPCPTKGIVNIDINYADYNYSEGFYTTIEIYNLFGQRIQARNTFAWAMGIHIKDTFSLRDFPSGIYFVKIDTGFYVFVSKIMLSK